MADFVAFESDTAHGEGGDGMHEGGEHGPEPEHHYSERGSHDAMHYGTGILVSYGATHWFPSHIPAELIVLATYLAVFAICLAAMLPWYYASCKLIHSSAVSTHSIEDGLMLSGSMTTVDPLTLAATMSLSFAFVGCTNAGSYSSDEPSGSKVSGSFLPNSTLPQIDESLDLFWMDSNCLNNMTGQNWAFINNEYAAYTDLQANLTVLGKFLSATYTPFDEASEGEAKLTLKEVSPYQNYPFDSYSTELMLSTYFQASGGICAQGTILCYNDLALACCTSSYFFVSETTPVNGTYQTPLTIALKSNVVGFTVSFRPVQARTNIIENATSYIIYVDISRSSFTQGLSMFIVVVMWGISLGITVLTLDATYFRHYKPVSLGMAGLCATMLFALPSLRAVQPGIPPTALYASIDIFSFFMNMALIASSLVLLLVKIIAENKGPSSPGPKQVSKSLPHATSLAMQKGESIGPASPKPGSMVREGAGSQMMRNISTRPSEAPKPSSRIDQSSITLNVNA